MSTDRKIERVKQMKKKLILKKWVEYFIISIQFIMILILGADCNDLNTFILSKIFALLIFYLNHIILMKYTLLGD